MDIYKKIKNIIYNNDNSIMIRNVIILGIIGFIFLFAGDIFFEPEPEPVHETTERNEVKEHSTEKTYISQVTRQLEEIVSLIKGVGEVRVMLLAEKGIEKKYEYNINKENRITNETDQNQGERRIEEENLERELVIISDSQGNEKPVVSVEKNPKISGVLIVAEGADKSSLRYEIIKAVGEFLDLPLHKINVLPHERR